MLLPDKHITMAESILGLGAVLLSRLDRAQSIDRLYDFVKGDVESGELPAYHDFDSVLLSVLFLFSIGAVELTASGGVRRCAS
jgi:hypothetical protein